MPTTRTDRIGKQRKGEAMIMLSNGNGQEPVPVSPECALRREVFSVYPESV
jgi:hypothetical protein